MPPLLRRILLLIIALLIIVGVVYAFMPRPIEVEVALLERGPLRVTVDEEGRTRVRDRYVVSAPLAGQLQRIALRAGDAVQAGQIVAVIEPVDPALLDVRARAEAEARVSAVRSAITRADAEVQRAEASLAFAHNEHQRLRHAFERGATTAHELEAATLGETIAQQALEASQSARQVVRFELQQAEAALLRTQPDHAEPQQPFQIPSPISGRVLRIIEESALTVAPGMPLLELGDPDELEIVVDVLSVDAVQIRPGAAVVINRWGGEQPLHGVVRLVEPSGFTKISALGVEEQRVNVIIDWAQPTDDLRWIGDGYRVEPRIVVWQASDVLKVPTSALFRVGREWAVFVVENERAVQRTVQIGRQDGVEAQVLDGLQSGDAVIVHPSDRVNDGTRVRLISTAHGS